MAEHEEAARQVIERVLGTRVVLHDHNVGRSIPDLRIEYIDRRAGYVEVVADESPGWRSLHAALDSGNRVVEVPGLTYDWWIWPHADAHVKTLAAGLPGLLCQLDNAGETFGHTVDAELDERIARSPFRDIIQELGIHRLVAGKPASGDAIARFVLPGTEGPVDIDLDRVPAWCAEFLHAPQRADVRRKLMDTGASERHAFIVVTISTDCRSGTRYPNRCTRTCPPPVQTCPTRSPTCGCSANSANDASPGCPTTEAGSTTTTSSGRTLDNDTGGGQWRSMDQNLPSDQLLILLDLLIGRLSPAILALVD